jgi:hypothetical protein
MRQVRVVAGKGFAESFNQIVRTMVMMLVKNALNMVVLINAGEDLRRDWTNACGREQGAGCRARVGRLVQFKGNHSCTCSFRTPFTRSTRHPPLRAKDAYQIDWACRVSA